MKRKNKKKKNTLKEREEKEIIEKKSTYNRTTTQKKVQSDRYGAWKGKKERGLQKAKEKESKEQKVWPEGKIRFFIYHSKAYT